MVHEAGQGVRGMRVTGLSVPTELGGQHCHLLNAINLDVSPGAWLAVVGPNGAGKSTLLKSMAGLIHTQGEVLVDGVSLAQLGSRQRARTLAWLGQDSEVSSLAAEMDVLNLVMLGRLPHLGVLASPGEEDHAVVEQMLRDVGMWALRHRRLGSLSGGERQRALLARMMAVQAAYVLMDEPLNHLDPPFQAQWVAWVRRWAQSGVGVVSVLHDLGLALCADQVLVLQAGSVLYCGPSNSPACHQAICRVFDHKVVVEQLNGRWVVLPVLASG